MKRSMTSRHHESDRTYRRGESARANEQESGRILAPVLQWTAQASMSGALALQQDGEPGDFVGQWAPTLQILGRYPEFTRFEA